MLATGPTALNTSKSFASFTAGATAAGDRERSGDGGPTGARAQLLIAFSPFLSTPTVRAPLAGRHLCDLVLAGVPATAAAVLPGTDRGGHVVRVTCVLHGARDDDVREWAASSHSCICALRVGDREKKRKMQPRPISASGASASPPLGTASEEGGGASGGVQGGIAGGRALLFCSPVAA